jgi:phosphohistidine phosphatase
VHHADVVKMLYLLRHLKSSWDDDTLADHDRPLAPRGRKAGQRMARHLQTAGVTPELVLCSPSVRTRQTLEAVREAIGEPDARFPGELYAASREELLAVLRGVEPDVASVLVIAHNPGLEDLAVTLAGRGDDEARQRLREKFPTGAFATLSFDGAWATLAPGECELAAFVVPRELG